MNRIIAIAIISIVVVAIIIFVINNPGQCNAQKGPVDVVVEQIEQDPAIKAEIDSSQLINGDLVVKFHHSAEGEQPVSITGSVDYELSKNTAKRCEQLTLTVKNWNENSVFELKIGQQSDKFRFGVLRELKENVGKRTENSKTFQHYENSRPINKFTQVITIGPSNYLDKNGEWQEINTSFEQKGGGFVADRMEHKIEADDSGILIKKKEFSLEFLLEEGKEPEISGNKATYNYDDYSVSWYATTTGTKNEIYVKKNLGAKTFRFEINRNNAYLSESDDTINIISNGEAIGTIQKPYIIDANGNVITDKTSVELVDDFYELTVNDEGVAAPYTIDPTVTLAVAADADDAYELAGGTGFSSSGSDIFMSSNTAAGSRYNGGFRFQSVNVPQGADITSALWQVYITGTTTDDPNVDIYANDVDNANDFSTEADVTSRTLTTANVRWTTTNLCASGCTSRTDSPDIKTVIEEVTDRDGWRSGNAIVLLPRGRSDSNSAFAGYAYESAVTNSEAQLQITYSVESAADPTTAFQNPTPNNGTYPLKNFIEINVTSSNEVDECTLEWSYRTATGSADIVSNYSIEMRVDTKASPDVTYCYANRTGLAVGNYTYRVFGISVNNTLFPSPTRHAFINQSGFNFTVPTPINGSVILGNYSTEVTGLDAIYVNLTSEKDVNATAKDMSMYIDLNKTLVLYMSMDHIRNAAGDNISRDNSTYGHNGTLYNMGSNIYGNNTKCSHNAISGKSVEAKFGGACLFDGFADHISINSSTPIGNTLGYNDSLNMSRYEELTVEAWVRGNITNGGVGDATGPCGGKYCIVARSAVSGAFNSDYAIGIAGNANTKFAGFVRYGTTNDAIIGNTNRVAGTWYHVAMVFNKTHLTLYVNGVIDQRDTVTATNYTISHRPNYNLTIGKGGGAQTGSGGRFFNGTIDEVRIYGRALSDLEINASINASSLYRLEANFTNLTHGNYSLSAGYTNITGGFNRTPTWNVVVGSINKCMTLTQNGNYSLPFSISSNGGTCINISRTVTNLTFDCRNYTITYGSTALGYAFNISSNNTVIKNCNIKHGGSTASSHAVLFNGRGNNIVTFQNSTIHTAAATSKAAVIMSNGTYTFLNVTFQKDRISYLGGSHGNLSVKWYLDVYVNDSGGNAISGARVDAVNKSTCGSDKCVAFNTTTGSDGFIRNVELTELVNDSDASYVATNYTLTASGTGFGGVTKQLNITNSTYINLQLIDRTPPNITFSSPTPQNGSYNTNYIFVNITVGDTGSDIGLCTLKWNGVNETMSMNVTANTSKYVHCYVNKTSLSEGRYNITVYGLDSAGNENSTNRTIKIDTTAPASINFVSPTDENNSAWSRNSTYINTSWIENNENDTIKLEWNGTNITLDDPGRLLVMSFDNNTHDTSRYNTSGSAYGDINCSIDVAGQRGSACKLGGGNSYIKINYNESLYRGTGFTAGFWLKMDNVPSTSGDYVIRGNDFDFIALDIGVGSPYYCLIDIITASESVQAGTSGCLATGTWYYVTLTWDGSTARIYLNGAQVASQAGSGPRLGGGSGHVYIGSLDGAQYFFNGTIDELEIYGRVLSSAEITNRMNATYPNLLNGTFRAGRHFFNYTNIPEGQYNYTLYVNDTANNTAWLGPRVIYIDRTNATLTFADPTRANGTYGYGYINVNISINDTTAVDSCMLEWNGVNESMGKRNLTGNQSVHCFTNKTSLVEGNYTYRIWANDTANNTALSAQRHVFMDLTGSELNFQGPMVPSGSYNFNYLYINVSANDTYSNINSCTLELGIVNPNSNNLTNESMSLVGSGKGTVCFINRTNLVDSNYTYRVFVQDSNGNANVTPFRHMLVDKIRPTFVIPTINGSFNFNWVFVNASTNGTSTDVDRCNLELFSESNGTRANWTMTKTPSGLENTVYCHLNVTGLPNGNFSFRVYSNDSAGNIDASEIKHQYIDTIRSALSFSSPTRINGSYNVNYVYVNISVNDVQTNLTGVDVDLCNMEWNGVNESITLANITSNNTFCFANKTSLGDGNYTYRVFSNDTAGNLNSSTRHAYIDTALPEINFTAPSLVNDTYVTRSLDVNVSVNGTGTDVDQCSLEWNGINQSMAKTRHADIGPNFYSCFVTKSSLAAVNYTYRVFSNDSAGNLNASETRHANIELPTSDLRVGFSLEFNISDSGGDSASADGKGVGRYTATSTGFSNYYVCNEDTSISKTPTFGIVFAGRQFDYAEIRSGNSFRLNLSQVADSNRFIIPVTIGGCNNLRTGYSDVIRPLGSMTRAFVQFVDVTKNPVEVILSYPDIDFVGNLVKSGAFTITLEKNESGRVAQIIFRD